MEKGREMSQQNNNINLKHWIYCRIKAGMLQMHANRTKRILFVSVCVITVFLLIFKEYIWKVKGANLLDKISFYSSFFLISTLVLFMFLYLFGQGRLACRLYKKFHYIGMKNHIGQVPILLYKNHLENNLFCMLFESRGISIEEWITR